MDKKELRNYFKGLRNNVDKASDILIRNKLFELSEYKNAKTIFTYISVGSETDTREIINVSLSLSKTVAVPKCETLNHTMKFMKIRDLEIDVAAGAYGISEPVGNNEVIPSTNDLIIVPALAYDLCGNRLGYGGGYYDRFLAEYKKDTPVVGLTYEILFTSSLPTDKNDIPADIIITERRIIRIK